MPLSDVAGNSTLPWAVYERLSLKVDRLYLMLDSFGQVGTAALGNSLVNMGHEISRVGAQLIMHAAELDAEMAAVQEEEEATRAVDLIDHDSAVECLRDPAGRDSRHKPHSAGGGR